VHFIVIAYIDRTKPANNIQPTQNEANNPLANLLCQYNSDSDTEDPKKDAQKLDDQVNDFLKVSSCDTFVYVCCIRFCICRNFNMHFLQEIQLIAPEQSVSNTANDPSLATKATSQSMHHTSQQTCKECIKNDRINYKYPLHEML